MLRLGGGSSNPSWGLGGREGRGSPTKAKNKALIRNLIGAYFGSLPLPSPPSPYESANFRLGKSWEVCKEPPGKSRTLVFGRVSLFF